MKTPYLQVRNNCLLYYQLPTVSPPREYKEITEKAYSGRVTKGAKKRIEKAIDILVQKSPYKTTFNPITQKTFPFRLNFITLTISQKKFIDADVAYRQLLKPLLRILRKYGDFSYLWKAEFQGDYYYNGKKKKYGGQLHYHLASNTFIPWTEIRKEWNKLQYKNGLLKSYALKHKNYNPNSIDVHSVYKVRNLAAYLGKYLAKSEIEVPDGKTKKDLKTLTGKVWDCSRDLKLNRFAFVPTGNQYIKISAAVKNGSIKQIDLEHCTLFVLKNPLKFLTSTQYLAYKDWQNNVNIIKPKNVIMPNVTKSKEELLKDAYSRQNELQGLYFKAVEGIMEAHVDGDLTLADKWKCEKYNIAREQSELIKKIFKLEEAINKTKRLIVPKSLFD